MLNGSFEEQSSRTQQLLAYAQGSAKILGNAVYHALDFARIGFVLSALTGRWLFQLSLALSHHNMAPSSRVMQAWLGWPVFGGAFTLALAAKGYNHYYRENYPAAQDYLFSLFSSSILYFILDLVIESGKFGSLSIGWFIATTILVPLVSAIACKLVIPDSADHVIRYQEFISTQNVEVIDPEVSEDESDESIQNASNKEAVFPAYAGVSRTENGLNALAGLSYGSAITALLWTINREINGKTVPVEIWQLSLIAIYNLIAGFAGYSLNSYPRAFHAFVAFSKGMRDSAYAYAGYSGLAFLTLLHSYQCKEGPCWSEEINMHLTGSFIPAAMVIGLFSALTTLFRYSQNYQGNVDLIKNIKWVASFFSRAGSEGGEQEQQQQDEYQRLLVDL